MEQKLRAVYHAGGFFPRDRFQAPEGTEFDLIVSGPVIIAARVENLDERRRILREITKRMKENPLPAGATRFSREELHERR